MEYIEQIINTTIQSFDFSFCIVVNILTYLIIKALDEYNPTVKISTWSKRIVMLGSIIAVGIVYYLVSKDIKLILNSAILAPVFWSWIGKPIVDKLGVGYNTKVN